jgi:diguanylate cyclase (GGDEF)-like protein/PAS domain S-box-containing protein
MSLFDFENFFELSTDLLCIASAEGHFKRTNPAFLRILGWTLEELSGQPWINFIHPEDQEAARQELEKLLSGQPTFAIKNRFRCSDGTYRHLEWTAFLEMGTGLIFAIGHDLTELVQENQRFQLALEAAPAALLIVDRNGMIQLVNRETERLFGYSRDRLIGETIERLVPAGSQVQHQQERKTFFQNPKARAMGVGRYVQALRQDGTIFPVEIGLSPVQFGDQVYVVCTVIDLTLQKQVEEKMLHLTSDLEEANKLLAQLAVTDRLTNIPNRRAFDEQIDKQIRLMGRIGRPISLLMIDIDHFKHYNDQYGHPAGDEILKNVANLLSLKARRTDLVARYGGEEFAVILPSTNETGALLMAERFQEAIRTYPWAQGKLTVSIGISTIFVGKQAHKKKAGYVAELISAADRALYHSKKNGRDRVTHAAAAPDLDQDL